MLVKVDERREAARRLRAERGWSVKRIARTLRAAQSSVSVWVRDIELTPDQRLSLARGSDEGRARGNARTSARAREARQQAQAEGRHRAKSGSALHAIGCMLFWGEGSKERNRIVFTNADPDMMALFVRFLRDCYGVRDEQLSLTCNCFLNNGLTLREIEHWWLDRLGLPESSIRRAVVNRPSNGGTAKHRRIPYGTARLVLCSTATAQSIYGAIQEYAGIERPDWLDCRPGVPPAGLEMNAPGGTPTLIFPVKSRTL